MAPVTGMQFGSAYFFRQLLFDPQQREAGVLGEVLIAALAGFSAGICSTPNELIVVQMQKKRISFSQALAEITSVRTRNIFTGFLGCASRDSIATVGYMTLAPLMKDFISRKFDSSTDSPSRHPVAISLVSSIVCGIFTATISHPFDCIKTIQQSQSFNGKIQRKEFRECLRQTVEMHGISRLYQGFFPRCIRVIGSVFILSECKQRLGPLLL